MKPNHTLYHIELKTGKALGRPALLPAPGFALKAMLGQMASELLLSGQRPSANKLTDSGFVFKYPDVKSALESIY